MDSLMKGLFLALWLAPLSLVAAEPEEKATFDCKVGPVQREFGASAWNIYACSDGTSVVVVPNSVVNGEFGYFFVTPNGQGVHVAGEGWGKDASFHPVFKQLSQVTAAELSAVFQTAHAAHQAGATAK
jgi:hypothetical protein